MGKTSIGLARTCRANGNVERKNEDLGIDRLCTSHKVETNFMVVMPEPVELEPEHIRRRLRSFLDRGAARDTQSVGHSDALSSLRHQKIGARPHKRRATHWRHADRGTVAASEQLYVDGRQCGHHAVARNDLDGVQSRPIVGYAHVVAGASVAIFERKKRHVARGVAPQPRCGRKIPVVLLKVRVLVDRSDRRFLRRHVMHREFPSLSTTL